MQVEGDRQIQPSLFGRDERQVGRPDGICVLDIEFSVQQVGADRDQVVAVGGSDESARVASCNTRSWRLPGPGSGQASLWASVLPKNSVLSGYSARHCLMNTYLSVWSLWQRRLRLFFYDGKLDLM